MKLKTLAATAILVGSAGMIAATAPIASSQEVVPLPSPTPSPTATPSPSPSPSPSPMPSPTGTPSPQVQTGDDQPPG